MAGGAKPAKCARCGRRMAKRACPALGVRICQLCCGSLRQKEVHCPPGCGHLAAHAPYQENKILARKPAVREDVLEDERMAWLAFHVESVLRDFAAADPSFSDREVLLALDHARDKTARGRSRILIPGAAARPGNAAGELILEAVDSCRYTGSLLVSAPGQAYSLEEKAACLEVIGLRVRRASGRGREGRRFLDDLEARFGEVGRASGSGKLIIPGS